MDFSDTLVALLEVLFGEFESEVLKLEHVHFDFVLNEIFL